MPIPVLSDLGRLFVHPDYSTLWAAVQALGAIVALLFIYRQVADGRHVSAYEFLRREDDRFRSAGMTRHRSKVARMLLLRPSGAAQRTDYYRDVADQYRWDLSELLGYFEDLGLLLRRRLVPEYFVWTMNCSYVVRYWKLLADYIAWERSTADDATYYTEFEHLYQRMIRFERCKRGREGVEPSEAQLSEFLARELHLTLRRFSEADLAAVLRIEKLSFGADAYALSRFQELAAQHPDGFLVAEIPGDVVGYIIAYLAGGVGEIDSVAVAPAYRRTGVARRLTKAVLEDFREMGASVCGLEVRTTNTPALRFYELMGFRLTETLAGYYSDGGDAYRMQRELAQGAGSAPPAGAARS